jgi:hypothetical protein
LVNNGQELAGTINNLFDMGLARDPDFFNGWYEWGLFLIQATDRNIRLSNTSPESVTDAAIDKYDHAIRLVKTDSYLSEVNAYFWFCKAKALVRRAELSSTPGSLRRQLMKHAKSEYEKYGQLVANIPTGQARSGDEPKIEAELQRIEAVVARQNGGP